MVVNDAIVYYSFDDADLTGSNPDDLSGNGNDGTNVGATTGGTGIINEDFNFDGTDYVSTNWNPSFTTGGAFNIWRKSTDTTQKFLLAAFNGGTQDIQIIMNLGVSNRVRFSYTNATGTLRGYADLTNANNGSYHMISISFNPTTDVIDFYIDGVKKTTVYQNQETPGSLSVTIPLYMGCRNNSGSPDFCTAGDFDETGIYQHTFVQADVDTLYNSGAGFNPYASSGYSNKVLGVVGSKVNGVDVANISKVNGI